MTYTGKECGKKKKNNGVWGVIYVWFSLVAQLVNNPPATQEPPVQFLGQKDPLEKGQTTLYRTVHIS